jgi:hypothetical protein
MMHAREDDLSRPTKARAVGQRFHCRRQKMNRSIMTVVNHVSCPSGTRLSKEKMFDDRQTMLYGCDAGSRLRQFTATNQSSAKVATGPAYCLVDTSLTKLVSWSPQNIMPPGRYKISLSELRMAASVSRQSTAPAKRRCSIESINLISCDLLHYRSPREGKETQPHWWQRKL